MLSYILPRRGISSRRIDSAIPVSQAEVQQPSLRRDRSFGGRVTNSDCLTPAPPPRLLSLHHGWVPRRLPSCLLPMSCSHWLRISHVAKVQWLNMTVNNLSSMVSYSLVSSSFTRPVELSVVDVFHTVEQSDALPSRNRLSCTCRGITLGDS